MIKESFARVGADIAENFKTFEIKASNAKPEIFVGLGLGLVVAGGIYACIKTTEAPKIVEEHTDKIEKIKTYKNGTSDNEQLYSDADYRKDIAKTYLNTGMKLVKVYYGPVIVATIGIGCVLYGHGLLKKENAEILAAYGTMQKAFDTYRGRVREKYGDEIERKIFNGEEEIEEEVIDEKGKKKKTKRVVVNPIGDPYTVIFEEVTSPTLWTPVASTNRMNVLAIQAECNRMLEAHGYLFLNDVLRMLGMKETEISRKVGWIKHKDGEPYVVGDNEGFVDFGLFRRGADYNSERYRFLNGDEPNFTLHFNVQGVIIDKFETASTRAI